MREFGDFQTDILGRVKMKCGQIGDRDISLHPNATHLLFWDLPGDPSPCIWGVEPRAEFSLLGQLFLGPGFRLGARWNRLVETVKTRKKRGKTGKQWARYSLRSVKEGS